MKRILMIAYHFPPLAGSSGIQRTLRFIQHLPKFGWKPMVLSANPRAYERTSEDLDGDVPSDTIVRRAFALDTARHLSIGGRYAAAWARPDRWVSWKFDAVRQGMRMIREFRPQIIWSTYPIATAHLIGAELHKRSGIPWVADFRDPMAQDDYPTDPTTRQKLHDIEAEVVNRASLSVFTTPGAARICRQRYPESAERIRVIENGYDEESFADVTNGREEQPLNLGALTLLHSGIVYPSERDPTQLFVALASLKEADLGAASRLRIRFRAAVHDDLINQLVKQYGVEDLIEILPPIPYKQALAEMTSADALLVMQAANCNEQIPAKIYEYLRAGRPILGLTDQRGDTAGALRAAGCNAFASLDSSAEIHKLLLDFLSGANAPFLTNPEIVRTSSRMARTEHLAHVMNSISR